jgi:hypothetical protein
VCRLRDAFAISILLTVFMVCFAHAEVVTIDVTVKKISVKERMITVTKIKPSKTNPKDIELEVTNAAKIMVGGKKTTLEAIKANQKASISYETGLEVVTRIEVAEPDLPVSSNPEISPLKKSGCRLIWTISENGESAVAISRPLAKRELAKNSLIRHNDGTIEFRHNLDSQESVDKVLAIGESVEFNKSRAALIMTPKKPNGANFIYNKNFQLPAVIDIDLDSTIIDPAGVCQLTISFQTRGKDVEFPYLYITSPNSFSTSANVYFRWVSGFDSKRVLQFDNLFPEQTVDLSERKEFAFKIPKITNDSTSYVRFISRGDIPMSIQHLSMRGRLKPMIGLSLAYKNGVVVIDKVVSKSLAETVGVKPGDIIESIGGTKPLTMLDAQKRLSMTIFGEKLAIVVNRGGKTVELSFILE